MEPTELECAERRGLMDECSGSHVNYKVTILLIVVVLTNKIQYSYLSKKKYNTVNTLSLKLDWVEERTCAYLG